MDPHAANLALSYDQDAYNLHDPAIAEPGHNRISKYIGRPELVCLFAGCDASFDEGLLDALNAHVKAHFADLSEVNRALAQKNDLHVGAFDMAVNPRGFQSQSIAQSIAPAMNMAPNGNLGRAIPHTTADRSNMVGRARSICITCNKTFSRRADMERHAKKHQPTMRIYHCSVGGCEYGGSYRKDKLEAHVKNCH